MKQVLGWVRDLEKTVAAIEAESKPRQQLLYTLEGLCTLIRDWAIAFRQKPDAVKKPSNRKPSRPTPNNELWASNERKGMSADERARYYGASDRERMDRHKGANDTTHAKPAEQPRRWVYNRSGSKQ